MQEKPEVRQGMDVTEDCEAHNTFYRVRGGRRVLQYFYFGEKRGRSSAHFGRGKEHAGQLLVPARRGNRRMQWRGGM
jgi:hypothetical protein